MAEYGFEYFCGANVTVRINSIPIVEASAISYNINESKFPLYGYSSRFYNAIARGNVLVTGNLAINFIHQNYLSKVIQYAYNALSSGVEPYNVQQALDIFNALTATEDIIDEAELDAVADSLKSEFWGAANNLKDGKRLHTTLNPHDNFNGIDIEIIFGEQNLGSNTSGVTGVLLQDVHFTGRSDVISISEEALVEVYPFIARDVRSLKSIQIIESPVPIDGETEAEVIGLTEQMEIAWEPGSFTSGE